MLSRSGWFESQRKQAAIPEWTPSKATKENCKFFSFSDSKIFFIIVQVDSSELACRAGSKIFVIGGGFFNENLKKSLKTLYILKICTKVCMRGSEGFVPQSSYWLHACWFESQATCSFKTI